jgi:hypothetical protein
MPVPALHVAEVADVGEPPTVELEPPPEHGRRRQRSFRLRSSERQHEGQSDEPVEEPEVAPAVEEAPRSGTPVPALLVAAIPEEPEPAATATTGEEPEPPRERGRRRRRSFRIRSSERQTDRQGDEPVKATEAMPIVEQVPSVAAVTALAGAEAHGEGEPAAATTPVDGATEFTERIAGYAFAYQRRSGADRRSGGDRRKTQVEGFEESLDRRAGGERRSGLNRRRTIA